MIGPSSRVAGRPLVRTFPARAEITPVSNPLSRPDPVTHSKLELLLRPLHAFLSAESAGGVVLMIAAAVALAWANSPWEHGYHEFWQTKLSVGAGRWTLAMSLEHWVN